ncbi:MAG: GTPase Era [Phototrophicales bacterium]|nr:MAG: GTPase Era [Phototrophicales bacterium]
MTDLDSIFTDVPPDHRSGIVAVVGRPNAGKSTLINRIIGHKIAAVSPKPQTTRKRQLGILTDEQAQILFTDTPGLHLPQHRLGEYMVRNAEAAFRDADLILVILDVTDAPDAADRHIAETIARLRGQTPVFLALNKIDAVPGDLLDSRLEEHALLIPHDRAFPISALDGTGVPELVDAIREQLPFGPRYYPAEDLTEVNMRFIAAEIIREKVMINTEKEIPYSVAVEIESFQEKTPSLSVISAVIYVERESQKGIIVGAGGSMIKRIGIEARTELELLFGVKIHLDLRVKVLKDWRSDEKLMKRLGYRIQDDD